jgi:hypothetical protein
LAVQLEQVSVSFSTRLSVTQWDGHAVVAFASNERLGAGPFSASPSMDVLLVEPRAAGAPAILMHWLEQPAV